MNVFNKERIDLLKNKVENGISLTRQENFEYRKEKDTRNSNVKYLLDSDEMKEFAKCFNSFKYFLNFSNINLKPHQIEIIDNFENKLSLNRCSYDMGYKFLVNMYSLWLTTFHIKRVFIYDKTDISSFLECYKRLPYFLKSGIVSKSKNRIRFDNGSFVSISNSKTIMIGSNYDRVFILSYSKKVLSSIVPIISASKYSKLNLHYTENNKEYNDIMNRSNLKEGHPNKLNFKTLITYWYEDKFKTEEFKNEIIAKHGKEYFDKFYELV